MESRIFTLSGYLNDKQQTSLKMNLNPPIYLDPSRQHFLGVIGVQTFYHIPNVTDQNNILEYGNANIDYWEAVKVPPGTYKMDDIYEYLKTTINANDISGETIDIYLNNNTLRTHLKCAYDVRFGNNSIGPLFGFTQKVLKKNKWYISDEVVKSIGSNSLSVHCNIVGGSYQNGKQSHIMHQFYPEVPPGFKIISLPQPPIYLPVITDTITELIIQIEDEYERPVNFNQELVTVTLHLKS